MQFLDAGHVVLNLVYLNSYILSPLPKGNGVHIQTKSLRRTLLNAFEYVQII